MQRYTILFITVNALHVPGGFSAHHQEFKNCTHNIGYMPSLLAATASVGELELTYASGSSNPNSPALAVAASKLDIYRMLCLQFLSSWWWTQKQPETCRASTVIKNIVWRCILLVILKKNTLKKTTIYVLTNVILPSGENAKPLLSPAKI
jgi:hypothetical protein